MDKKLLTFKEWAEAGYTVRKGEKYISRNKYGECLFSQEQVVVIAQDTDPDEEDPYKDRWLFT